MGGGQELSAHNKELIAPKWGDASQQFMSVVTARSRYTGHQQQLNELLLVARQLKSQGLRGPFLSTRPVHFYAAIRHILFPPLTGVCAETLNRRYWR